MNNKIQKLVNSYYMVKAIIDYCPDFDSLKNAFKVISKIKRLAMQHHRQCENDCNGIGYIPRKGYFYIGAIDEYARRTYGESIQSAYIDDDTTVFHAEIERIESRINLLALNLPGMKIEYQHDPRGYTVKCFFNGRMIDWDLI